MFMCYLIMYVPQVSLETITLEMPRMWDACNACNYVDIDDVMPVYRADDTMLMMTLMMMCDLFPDVHRSG